MNIVKTRYLFPDLYSLPYTVRETSLSLVPDLSDLTSQICSAILRRFGVVSIEGLVHSNREVAS